MILLRHYEGLLSNNSKSGPFDCNTQVDGNRKNLRNLNTIQVKSE